MASTSTATPSMIHLDARLDSFKAVLKPKSRAKPAFPLDPARYPDLTPTDLANAGFFHDPGPDEDTYDTCKCFICGLKLGGWDETDNPFEEHHKRGSCAWAEFVCGPVAQRAGKTRLVYKNQDDLPSSESSATYREITYQKAWPHKAKAGFQPTVKNLAKAGFVLQATSVSPDGVWCPFCEYGVEGWEADDDPWTIHLKKSPQCDFFTAQLEGVPPAKGKAAKAPRKTIKRGQRATEVASQSEAPSDVPDTTDNEPSGSQPKPRRKVPARGKTKRGAETDTDLDSAAESQVVQGDLEEVVPVDFGDDEEPATKAKAAPKARKVKGKARQTQVDAVTETELESQAESMVDTQDEEVAAKRGTKKGSRKKTIGSKASSRADVESTARSEVEASEMEAEDPGVVDSGKSTRSKGKAPAPVKRTGKTRRDKEDTDMRSEVESAVEDERAVDEPEQSGAEMSEAEDRRATIKSGKSKASKSSKPTKASSKTSRTKRAPKDSAAEDSEVPISEVEDSAAEQAESSAEDRRRTLKSTKSKSTRSKKVKAAGSDFDQTVEEDEPAPKAKSKSQSKSAPSRSDMDPALSKASKSSKSSSSRSKSAKSAPAVIETESEGPSELVSEVEPEQAAEARSKSAPAPRKVAPKPRQTKKASAPPTSAPSTIRAPSQSTQPTQMHVLTQLDRFANVPPSSPFPEESTPKAKSISAAARPTRPSPSTQLPRETLNASLVQGAAEARRVVEQVVLHVTGADGDDMNSRGTGGNGGKDQGGAETLEAKLTEEEMQMTLEELVRLEYKKRYEVMQREGEEMIRKWEARSSEARSRIESL